MKCPYKNGSYCFHKHNRIEHTPHRRMCEYKKCENCEFFLEWKEGFEENRWEVPTKPIKATYDSPKPL